MAVRAPHGSNYSYEKMKARHKEAYGYLSRALQIDEAGVGEWRHKHFPCVQKELCRNTAVPHRDGVGTWLEEYVVYLACVQRTVY